MHRRHLDFAFFLTDSFVTSALGVERLAREHFRSWAFTVLLR